MKITRLKRGYRVSLTDTEFEALTELVRHGQSDFEGEDPLEHGLSLPVSRVLTKGRFSMMAAMRVDEDRRG